MRRRILILSAFLSLFVAGVCVGYFFQLQPEENSVIENSANLDTENFDAYTYTLEQRNESAYEQKLVRTHNVTGEETVVIESVKEAMPALRAQENLILTIISQPSETDSVILKSVFMDTDNPGGIFYRFIPETKSFEELTLNEEIETFFSGMKFSPDGRFVVWSEVDETSGDRDDLENRGFQQKLVVGDLIHDNLYKVVTLTGSETLNGGWFALSAHHDIEWVDGKTIKYAVYDQVGKEENPLDSGSESARENLIEYRTLSLE